MCIHTSVQCVDLNKTHFKRARILFSAYLAFELIFKIAYFVDFFHSFRFLCCWSFRVYCCCCYCRNCRCYFFLFQFFFRSHFICSYCHLEVNSFFNKIVLSSSLPLFQQAFNIHGNWQQVQVFKKAFSFMKRNEEICGRS